MESQGALRLHSHYYIAHCSLTVLSSYTHECQAVDPHTLVDSQGALRLHGHYIAHCYSLTVLSLYTSECQAVDPRTLVESQGALRLHGHYYITHCIIPSLERLLSLVSLLAVSHLYLCFSTGLLSTMIRASAELGVSPTACSFNHDSCDLLSMTIGAAPQLSHSYFS